SASPADRTVRLWNPATGEELAAFVYTGPGVLTWVALSPTGRWLATGDSGAQVRLWDLAEARRQLRQAGLDWPAPPPPVAPPPPHGSATALLEAARRHHLGGRYAEALPPYDQALALDGTRALAYRDRGEARLQLKRYAEALADFERAQALAPQLPLRDYLVRV